MTRRMLINTYYPEETRVAVADDETLLELEIERASNALQKGNIYKASITRIEPSLQAAFLDIGSSRNGFLQINDINPAYYSDWDYEANQGERRPSIQDILSAGQELVVQVVKDERAAKGATLTTNLSIPGRYLVLMVGNQRGGVSRKIVDEGQRRRLRQAVQSLKVPAGMGVIVRTAGINKSSVELQRDLDSLLELWHSIVENSLTQTSPKALYKETNLAIRTIRDYLTSDIDEILIDEKNTYEEAKEFIKKIVPHYESKVIFFDKPQPLFSHYHLDSQIDATSSHHVTLPSGGSIVINPTEAIVAVDVNSGRSTGQADVEETAFATNKEAAEAIATQLRLRDLGGLVVIDFIDMSDRRHRQVVERTLRDAVKNDKAKVEVGRISKFGLLEMSRQRIKSSLVSQRYMCCPHCNGRGQVMTAESAVLEVLRKVQSAVFAGGIEEVHVHMAPVGALMLLNNKRKILSSFEAQSQTSIYVYADGRKKPEEYDFELVTSKTEEAGRGRTARGKGESSERRGRGQRRRSGERRNSNRGQRRRGNNERRRRSRGTGRGRKGNARPGESESAGATVEQESSSVDSSKSSNVKTETPSAASAVVDSSSAGQPRLDDTPS